MHLTTFCGRMYVHNPWHTGFCLSFRREVLDQTGGLLEVGVLGSGDHHCFSCIAGKGGETCNRQLHPNYRAAVLAWQDRATRFIQGDLGFVPGTIMHNFHGPKANRRYHTRWEILVRHQFDPLEDVTKNTQGVLELTSSKHGLRDDIRRYFDQRNEDGLGSD